MNLTKYKEIFDHYCKTDEKIADVEYQIVQLQKKKKELLDIRYEIAEYLNKEVNQV